MQTYMELKCITYFLLLYSLSSNIQLAENVVVYVVQKETCQEAKTNEVNKLNKQRHDAYVYFPKKLCSKDYSPDRHLFRIK